MSGVGGSVTAAAAAALLNRIAEDLFQNVRDTAARAGLMRDLGDVRERLFDVLARVRLASAPREEDTLPDAEIAARFDAGLGKLVVDGDSVHAYCVLARARNADAPSDLGSEVYLQAHLALARLEASPTTREVSLSPVQVGKRFTVPRFTVRVG